MPSLWIQLCSIIRTAGCFALNLTVIDIKRLNVSYFAFQRRKSYLRNSTSEARLNGPAALDIFIFVFYNCRPPPPGQCTRI